MPAPEAVGTTMAYQKMTDREVLEFLEGPPARPGVLATVRPDGRAHAVPVWFALDDGAVVFTTGAETVKGRHLARTGRAAFCVDDDEPPFSFVSTEGPVELSSDLEEVRHWAAVIGGRYMGEDRAEEYGRRNGVPGELLVRLHLERTVAARDVAE